MVFAANKSTKKTADQFSCTNCGFGSHGPIVKCQSCRAYYVDEKITQEKISTYYEVAEDTQYFKEQYARKRTFSRYLHKLEQVMLGKGKLLDVGTNTGLFVRLALDDGWGALGIEPNKWAVEYARENYKINLINKPFEQNSFKPDAFDVITMWDVIEHFTNPVVEIAKVYKFLKPGGVFAFSTVDPETPFARVFGTKWSWFMEMHRVFWPRKTAEYYLKKVGFKKIIFKPHFRFLSLGYLATRLAAVSPDLSRIFSTLISQLSISKLVVPYYANDLYDCYAIK